MLIVLVLSIISVALISCGVCIVITNREKSFLDESDAYIGFFISGSLLLVIVIFLSVICIAKQVSAETFLYAKEQKRDALVESYNTYYDEYRDDIAHSSSLSEIRIGIAEFNAEINKNNSFCDNPWLNWFFVDCTSIEPISVENGRAK